MLARLIQLPNFLETIAPGRVASISAKSIWKRLIVFFERNPAFSCDSAAKMMGLANSLIVKDSLISSLSTWLGLWKRAILGAFTARSTMTNESVV